MKRETSGSLDELFRSRWGPSVRLATVLTSDRAVAEELVQEAFLEVMQRWDAAALALLVGTALVLRTADDDGADVSSDPAAEDPTAAGELAVIVVEGETIALAGDETTVRGHEGMIGTGSRGNDVGIADQDTGFAWVSWDETDAVQITLASRTFDTATLAAVAEGLVVDGDDVRLGPLPDGITGPMEPVGRLADVPFMGAPYAPAAAVGHSVYYLSSQGPTARSPPSRAVAAIRCMARAQRRVDLRDTQGGPASRRSVTAAW